MPVIFTPDANNDRRYSGHATVAYYSDNPEMVIIDDLGPNDLPEQAHRLVISSHPGQDRAGRDVRGRPDDPQKHSRHVHASDVTLTESTPPNGEDA